MDFDPFAFWSSSIPGATRHPEPMTGALELASKGISTLQAATLFWQRMWGMEKGRWGGLDSWKGLRGLFPFSSNVFPLAWGMVPIQEYLSLVRKYEKMKEKVTADEETIQHLRLLLESEDCGRKEDPQPVYRDLMKKQFDAFFALMRGMQLLR